MTDKMISLIAEISEQVGRIPVLQEGTISPHLRRENRIRTIHSSLAIEHNSLRLSRLQLFWMANAPSEIRMRSKRFKTPMI
nr:MAG TPA: Fic/DOC family N-terminal [Caudoviricetes sp.]